MKKLLAYSLLASSSLLLFACDDSAKSTTSADPIDPPSTTTVETPTTAAMTAPFNPEILENHRFELTSFDGQDIRSERPLYLEFNSDLQISGNMCNNFHGQGHLKQSVLTAQLGMTLMFCDNEQLNLLDTTFASMLNSGAEISYQDGVLTLFGEGKTLSYQEIEEITQNNSDMEVSMVKASDLIHHQYKLIKYNEEPVEPSIVAHIQFGENLLISGNMCNRFSGQGTLTDDVLYAPELAMTRMFCDQVELNNLDSVISSLFSEGATVTLKGDQLILTHDDLTLEYQLDELMQ